MECVVLMYNKGVEIPLDLIQGRNEETLREKGKRPIQQLLNEKMLLVT